MATKRVYIESLFHNHCHVGFVGVFGMCISRNTRVTRCQSHSQHVFVLPLLLQKGALNATTIMGGKR